MTDRLLVVVPAWDEAASVAAVVAEVAATNPDAQILVVDDGSRDGTGARAAAAGAEVIRLPFNLGVGGAMRAGFKFALRHGYDTVVQVDADGQHDPAYIPELVREARLGRDIVIGARFAGAGDYAVGPARRFAMRLLAASLSRTCGTRLTDVTSGFRLTTGAALPLFARDFPEEYLGDTLESLVLAARCGLRISQVPVAMRPRLHGESSQSPARAALYLARAGVVLGLAKLRQPPGHAAPDPSSTKGAP